MTTIPKKFLFILLFLLFPVFAFAGGSQQRSGVSVQTIINDAMTLFNEVTGSDEFITGDAQVLTWVNDAVLMTVALTKCNEAVSGFQLQTGISEYFIHSGVSYINIEAAIYSGASTTSNPNPYMGLEKLESIDKYAHKETGPPVSFIVWNDYVLIDPTPRSDENGKEVVLYYSELPSKVVLADEIPLPAIYEPAIRSFVLSRLFRKDKRFGLAREYMAEYNLWISIYEKKIVGIKPDAK